MDKIDLWDSEYRFMTIVWDNAPLSSGKLVGLCAEKLGWKKPTAYNAIRRMCEKGLIKNERSTVSVIIPKEKVQAMESDIFLHRTFNGSLPGFIASFLDGKSLSGKEADELKKLIDTYTED